MADVKERRAGKRIMLLRIRHDGGSGTTRHLYMNDADGNVRRTLRFERRVSGWSLHYSRRRKN